MIRNYCEFHKMSDSKQWTEYEDKILHDLYEEVGRGKWSEIAQKMRDDYKLPHRNGKQCRERYESNVEGCVKKSDWTVEEEE